MRFNLKLLAGSATVSVLSVLSPLAPMVQAADHQEAPATTAQVVADIGDYYAWHEGDLLNLILTFGTFASAGSSASFDSTVIYNLHFDTSAPLDGISDVDIHVRFGQDISGNWGMQIIGAGDSPIVGPVETVITESDVAAWAGVADDPFFFDLTGFNDTVNTGTISFNPSRDDVAGLNVTAIALQLPVASVQSGGSEFQTWATTGSL